MLIEKVYPEIKDNCIFKDSSFESISSYFKDEFVEVGSFSPSDIIYSNDSDISKVGIVLSGNALVSTGNENSLLKPLSQGEIFGIANLYSNKGDFPSVIKAKTKCQVVFFCGTVFKAFIENDRDALKNYLTLMSKKVVYLNRKISTLVAGSAEKKLVAYLLEIELDSVCSINVSMSALADMLNVGRASLYRAIDDLENRGLIKKNGKMIIISDYKALSSIL